MSTIPTHVWHNGNIVPIDQPVIAAFDGGLQFGEGCFETLHSYDGHPFKAPEHLARIQRNAAELGIHVDIDPDWIVGGMYELIRENGIPDARIKLLITAGNAVPGGAAPEPTFTLTIQPADAPPPEYYERGVQIKLFPWGRSPDNPIPHLKTLSYLENSWVRKKCQAEGAFEGVFLTNSGHLAEGTRSNFFLVKGGTVYTPPLEANILPGITRQMVFDLAASSGIPLSETHVTPDDLAASQEAFMTSTICEVLPVVGYDDKPIGDGTVGPITQKLHDAFREFVNNWLRSRNSAAST